MLGAEESGGYGFGMHLPERDGVYADLMLLDLFLRERAAGPPHGVGGAGPFPRARRAVVLPAHRRARRRVTRIPALKDRLLVELRERGPRELDGHAVTRTDPLSTGDGFKFFTADGSWLLVRFSGTEPLVRVYTEAATPDQRDAYVKAGERLVREA